MRSLKRALRCSYGEFRIRDRRRDVMKQLANSLNLSAIPVLRASGGAGHDSIYKVYDGGRCIGVLRLLNPYRERPNACYGQPFMRMVSGQKIERELHAYTVGARHGLTPEPVWSVDDALLCSYVP